MEAAGGRRVPSGHELRTAIVKPISSLPVLPRVLRSEV